MINLFNFKVGSPADIMARQMGFLFNEGRKIAMTSEEAKDKEDDLQIQKEIEKDLFADCHASEEDGCEHCESLID